MVGADSSPYTGDGQVIAIIDSGVDVEHEAFQGAVPTDALTEAKLSDLAGQLNAGSGALTAAELRVDDKFPFAYDYADRDTNAIPGPETGLDHGTHVAGIAAANSGDTIRGVAPDAQVVAMKVFDDLLGQGRESNIIAAVEDAVTLGVDVINMSLGSDAGFSTSTEEQFQKIYDSVKSHGVILNVAAGNAYSSAPLGNEAGNNLPAVTNPDSSMLASPSDAKFRFGGGQCERGLPGVLPGGLRRHKDLLQRSDGGGQNPVGKSERHLGICGLRLWQPQ